MADPVFPCGLLVFTSYLVFFRINIFHTQISLFLLVSKRSCTNKLFWDSLSLICLVKWNVKMNFSAIHISFKIYVENNWNKNQAKIQSDLLTQWLILCKINYLQQRKCTWSNTWLNKPRWYWSICFSITSEMTR